MKKVIKILSIFLFLFVINLSQKSVHASLASSNELIEIRNENNQNFIVVTKDTTIEEIMAKYGSARIVSNSAFGGKAYTFYTDNNYSNFLYVETTNSGKIVSYGSIGTNFETQKHIGGQKRTDTRNFNLSGYVFEYDDVIYGVVQYNLSALTGKTSSKICTEYAETYKKDSSKYLRGISEHSVTFFNALRHFIGNESNMVFDERIFYINEQLKEFGSSIREYLPNMDKKSEYMTGIGVGEEIEIAQRNSAWLLNPLQIASMVSSIPYTNFGKKNIAVFDYDKDRKILSCVSVSANCFDRVDSVNLTSEEIEKLNSGRKYYSSAIKNLNTDSLIYEVEPVSQPSNISQLVAGELKASKKQGMTDYVNAIRAAAGLSILNLNEDCFITAQHISTLMSYRYLVLKQDITHQPAKETLPGITDEYYYTAVGWGKGYYENLGRSSTYTTVNTMTRYINMFLDDSSENELFFSHRQKLMHADFTEFGYGVSPQTFSNEFAGYNKNDIFLEAWPANGITFLETVYNQNRIYWTAQFTDKYKFLDTTDVQITCLNTGDTWNFTDEVNTSSKRYSIQTNNINSLNNRVVMYDSTIIPHEGYVYEVKLKGIREESTGNTVEYSYRTVFEYADLNNSPSQSNSIDIDKNKITLAKVENSDAYYLPIGEDVKLYAVLDNAVVDKKVTWTSSDPNVTVTQNGTVHASDSSIDHEVTISVTYDATGITSSVVLKPYQKKNQVVIEPNKVTINKGNNIDLLINELSSTSIEQISWFIVSASDTTKKYSYTDYKQYVEIVPYEDNRLKAKIIAHDAEKNNNKYIVIVEILDENGNTYTGECEVAVLVPLESLRISIKTIGIEMLQSSRTITVDLDKNNIEFLELKTKPTPVNITGNANAKWTVSNPSVLKFVEEYLDGKESIGKFQIIGEGETNVTAEVDGKTDTVKVVIKRALRNLSINGGGITEVAVGEKYALPYTRYPATSTDKVYFGSTNPNVATIDENGMLTFVGPGSTEIIISNMPLNPITNSAQSGSIYATSVFDVKIKINEINLVSSGVTSYDLRVGEYKSSCFTVYPKNNSYSDKIVYTSKGNGEVSINKSNGSIKGVKAGNVTVTATIDGKYTKSGKTITKTMNYRIIDPLKENGVIIQGSNRMLVNSSQEYTFTTNPNPTSDIVKIVRWENKSTNLISLKEENYSNVDIFGNNIINKKAIITAKGKSSAGKIATIRAVYTVNGGKEEYTADFHIQISDYLKGDLDRNGIINSNDAAIALDIYNNNSATDEDMSIGDMDNNNIINSTDAALILDIYNSGN